MTSLEKPCIAAGLFFLPRKTYANRPPQMNVFCSFVRCLIESAAPVRLEIVRVTKRRGVAPWARCIRTCRKRDGGSSGLRWATGRACAAWPWCRDGMRPRSAGRSDATRGSRPARANRAGRAGPGGSGRVRGRAAATWPGPRAAAASRCARRSANAHTGRTTGAVSASGRPTASSARGRSLHTEVGRRTRFPMAAIVPDETAAASVAAQEAMFSRLPAAARTGVTHDDGTEFARHAGLRDEPGMATYFADPHSSWRRGGNENRNGMIRRHPPKRTPVAPPPWHVNCRRSPTKPTTGPCECSAAAPPPRHSPTNRQNQPRTRMVHLQIDNGLDKLRASSLLSLIQYEICSYARITRRSRRSSLHFPSTT